MIYLILLLNFAISWWNCYAVGGMWAESKALGGFPRVLAWSGAIQAAIGFSMVFGFVIGGVLVQLHVLSPKVAQIATAMWYLAVIVPVLGTGLVITVHSWIVAFRERSMANMGLAAWNTWAQVSNTMSAVEGIGSAFNMLMERFSSDDDEDGGPLVALALGLAAAALASGALLAYVLICRYSNRLAAPEGLEDRFA